MQKMNWEKLTKRAETRRIVDELKEAKLKKRHRSIPAGLAKIFELALKRTTGSNQYRVVLSMQRQVLLRGWLTSKQGAYLKSLAGAQPSGLRHPSATPPVAGPGPAPGVSGLHARRQFGGFEK